MMETYVTHLKRVETEAYKAFDVHLDVEFQDMSITGWGTSLMILPTKPSDEIEAFLFKKGYKKYKNVYYTDIDQVDRKGKGSSSFFSLRQVYEILETLITKLKLNDKVLVTS